MRIIHSAAATVNSYMMERRSATTSIHVLLVATVVDKRKMRIPGAQASTSVQKDPIKIWTATTAAHSTGATTDIHLKHVTRQNQAVKTSIHVFTTRWTVRFCTSTQTSSLTNPIHSALATRSSYSTKQPDVRTLNPVLTKEMDKDHLILTMRFVKAVRTSPLLTLLMKTQQ